MVEDLDKWRMAGKIAAEALQFGAKLIRKGAPMIEVCDKIDQKIIDLGAKPAWPSQISCDHIAAHFTPDPDDKTLFENQLVCLDVGAHIDGCIGDNAITIDLSGKYSDLVKASEEALEAAIKNVAIGAKVDNISKAIHEVITSYGFSPVKNLSGHGLTPFVIHDKPGIPNYPSGTSVELKKGQVIAIEPFATTGVGLVEEQERSNIFSLVQKKPVRSPFSREILQFIEENFTNLPFTTRWISSKFGIGKTNFALKELLRLGIIMDYPPLAEKSKGMVTVREKTMLVDDKVEVLT